MQATTRDSQEKYLDYYVPIDKKLISFTVLFLGFAVWIFYFTDMMYIGLNAGLFAILIARTLFLVTSFYIMYLLNTNKKPEYYEAVVYVWWMLFIAAAVFTNFSRPITYTTHYTTFALAIMGMYFVPPNKFKFQVIPALTLTFINIIFLIALKFPLTTIISVIFAYVIANVFGIFLSIKLKELKIYQYEKLKNEEDIKNEYIRLNETKDKFFSIISHDIKTPLISFYSYSKMLHDESDKLNQEELKSIYSKLNNSAKKMSSLLDNLLNWASIESGNISIKYEICNPKKIIDNNFKFFEDVAEEKRIILKNSVDNDISINSDYEILNIVLRNLISNSIKYSFENEVVEVSAICDRDTIKIMVSDNGIGINPVDINNIFNIDKIFSNKGTKGEIGHGLGLIISQELIKLLNGDIKFNSEPNNFTIFTITLPNKKIE